MARIPRSTSLKIFEQNFGEWMMTTSMLLMAFAMLIGICWWTPTLIGYPFFLLYTRVFGWTLSPSESFWVTHALSFLVWLLVWLLRQIRNLFD